MERHILIAAFAVIVIVLNGCAPRVSVSPTLGLGVPHSIALLPVAYPSDIRREKAELVQDLLFRALESSGFRMLKPDIVSKACSSADCPERGAISSQYSVDGFLTLRLSSITRTNLLAGYYNTVSGALTLQSPSGEQLVRVEHSEGDKGGLIFNSGQIVQGLQTTAANLKEDHYPVLAERFVTTIVSRLPRPSSVEVHNPASPLVLDRVSVRELGNARFAICAWGTPGVESFLVLDTVTTDLREGPQGTYCANLYLERAVDPRHPPFVELHSAFGEVRQKAVPPMAFLTCDPVPFLKRDPARAEVKFAPLCVGVHGPDNESCEAVARTCRSARFLVFKGAGPAGPYERISTVKKVPWKEEISRDNSYAVIAVSRNGSQSAPQPLDTKIPEEETK